MWVLKPDVTIKALLKTISGANNGIEALAQIKEILEFLVSDENFSSFPVEKKTFKKYLNAMEVINLW